MKTRTRRDKYQPVLQLPPLSPDEEVGLRASIALHGVLVPILLAGDGRVIDGNNRKRIADELGYDCPETVHPGLSEEEVRALARSLNIARRQLDRRQRRQLVADQLREMPAWSNRRVAKALGVDHHTVASVRQELEGTGEIPQLDRTTGLDEKERPVTRAARQPAFVHRPPEERRQRIAAATLLHGDCRDLLPTIPDKTVDLILTDPPYPEIDREYGRMTEVEWHELMRAVIREGRRVLKPSGSMVVILHPNYDTLGRMRLWPWEFVLWAAKEWNLVQDVYWHAPDALPSAVIAVASRRWNAFASGHRPPQTDTRLPLRPPSHSRCGQARVRRFRQSSEFAYVSSSGLNSVKTLLAATTMSFFFARLTATVSRRGSSRNPADARR